MTYQNPQSKGGLMADERYLKDGTDRLLKATAVVKDIGKRRRAKMWLIAERIRKLYIPGGVTTLSGYYSDRASSAAITFSQGEYVDATGKGREHRWKITIENIDCLSEGTCPECQGEVETEILDDGKRRVACDECGYEVSSFCGVEQPE